MGKCACDGIILSFICKTRKSNICLFLYLGFYGSIYFYASFIPIISHFYISILYTFSFSLFLSLFFSLFCHSLQLTTLFYSVLFSCLLFNFLLFQCFFNFVNIQHGMCIDFFLKFLNQFF